LTTPMSEDAKAILLLCGRLGTPSAASLDLAEYNRLAQWLASRQLRPADLLAPANVLSAAPATGLNTDRLKALMERGLQLGIVIEQWTRSGLWILGRSDPAYPARLKTHLREKAPPILFGSGNQDLLRGGGLAIVGSRSVDEEGSALAIEAAEWFARHRHMVVSGGARGVDQIAMNAALDAGGAVLGVLADSLLKNSVSRGAREAIADGRLLLISPYHPEAGFSVGTAMGRNKIIYAMADYGLVISADHEKGGTWSGAVEELRRAGGRPVYIRMSGTPPLGNRKLLELGGLRWPTEGRHADPKATLAVAQGGDVAPESVQQQLFDDAPLAYGSAKHGPSKRSRKMKR
jgi:predicted Rossmann fold nucleotide-binding protein DprA/Smf involved in DNA uptake